MITEQQFKDYFCSIIGKEHYADFADKLEVVYRSSMKLFLDETAKPPLDSAIKKDAKNLLGKLRKMSAFSDVFICAEAGLHEYTLKEIASACERIAKEDGEKHGNPARLNTVFSLDVLFREFTGRDPTDMVDKKARAGFVYFVSRCFSVYSTYSDETAESAVKDYLKSDLPEKAACVVRMVALEANK